ncbi:MAG TPA: RNA polymerase sigma factor [Burkholderiaceae bacterium]|nr:RNA polymerase sigma factor [Burkholderiaceae bacterium]
MNADKPLVLESAAQAPSQEDVWVAAALQGDEAAFAQIMRAHNRALYRAARGIVADEAHAQDVVQEAYLRAFTRLASFRAQSSLKTWLVRIAINVALDWTRREGRQVALDAAASFSDASFDQESEMQLDQASQHSNPETVAARKQTLALLQWAIEQLAPMYRSVFMLRAVEELSVEETAQALGIKPDAVKTRFLRARAMLRDTLGARVEALTQEVYAFDGAACDAVVRQVISQLRQQGLIR